MPNAFVLFNTESGREEDIIRELKNIDEVKEVFRVYGLYDIIAKNMVQYSKIKDVQLI